MQNKSGLKAVKKHLSATKLLSVLVLASLFLFSAANMPQLFYNTYHVVYDEGGSLKEKASRIQSAYSENFKLKTGFIELNGLVHRVLGQREMNSVIKLKNGMLHEAIAQADVTRASQSCIELHQALEARGIPFIVTMAPSKVSNQDLTQILPAGNYDYGDFNASSFMVPLQSAGVNTLDLRVSAANQGLNIPSMFFKTDHHWLPETGFWAAQQIINQIDPFTEKTASQQMVMDPSNYQTVTYPNCLLGSEGRRTGRLYGGIDNLDIITPKFDTQLSLDFYDYGWNPTQSWEGSFDETMIDWALLQKKNIYGSEIYTAYGHGYPVVSVTHNPNAPCDKKILVVCDSFGQVVKPYLSLYCTELTSMYLSDEMPASFIEYVDQIAPDAVVILYSESVFSRGDAWFTFN